MKKLTKLMTVALLAVPAIIACTNADIYNQANAKHTTDLIVPAGFDWATTRSVTYAISTPKDTRITIYTDKTCRANSLLAETIVRREQASEISLELPADAENIYIQYPAANGSKTISVAIPTATRAADTTLTLPEDVEGLMPDDTGRIYYYFPKKEGEGTLMFEDNYPALGDYDMNDFVASYHIQSVMATDATNPNMGAEISLTIRAIGGTKPYRLALELPVLTSDIRGYYTASSNNPAISFDLISTDDDQPAIFAVNGTNSLREGDYYNTEKASTQTPSTLTLQFERNCFDDFYRSLRFWTLIEPTSYNFFLQDPNSKQEIHMKGYSATHLASNSGDSFASGDNFVWGFKVPELIPHPTECTDIKQAYDRFADWVTSGGSSDNSSTWYKNPNMKLVIQ